MSVDPENGSRDLIPRIWIPDPFGSSVPSVVEWSKALESDASAGGESPVRARRGHTAPTCNGVRVCGRNRTEARER